MTSLNTNLEALRLANHDFSFSLYNELAKNETGNLFFSPFSIHVIMFMASVGAASKTFDEMIATIHLNKTTHSLEAYKNLLDDLINKTDYLKLANGMFVDTTFNVKDSFVKDSMNYLKSSMDKLNFKKDSENQRQFYDNETDNLKLATGMFVDTTFNVKDSFVKNSMNYLNSSMDKLNFNKDPETQRQFINNWVLNKTNNKIKDLFPSGSINQDTALVLANAVHFKCGWQHKFNDALDEPFYLTPDNKVKVKMMTLRQDLQYYHSKELKFAALELPYEHDAFKMMILLPDAKDGLKDLEKNFSKINLQDISKKMDIYDVIVKLPRFKLEHTFYLEETLTNLGCPTMFTPGANFSNIIEGNNLYVSKVVHKAFIDVNENGTEAAAATGIVAVASSLFLSPRIEHFVADHPFLFTILTHANDVLFMGRLSKL